MKEERHSLYDRKTSFNVRKEGILEGADDFVKSCARKFHA